MRGADQPPRRQGQQMADADYDLGSGYDQPDAGDWGSAVQAARGPVRRYVNLAGAVTSVALMIGAGIWAYDLALRDVQGVPVIKAMEGPMRIAPENPGGEVIDYQGLAVNEVAAVGAAAPMPDRLILAPRAVELSEDDQAGLSGAEMSPDHSAVPAVAVTGEVIPELAADPLGESASPTAVAVDAALAEALGEIPGDLPEEAVVTAPDVDLAMEPLPEGAILVSPRPKPRPASVGVAEVSDTPERSAAVTSAVEVDSATIPIGTRLVQFGAFDTEEEARTEWVRLEARFGEVMAGKALVLQPAESGGRTFIRLRAHGFEDEDDARRFCATFTGEGLVCIPVPQR